MPRGTEAANSFETPTTFSFLQQPISQSVEHGSSVTFNCTAKYEQYSVRYRWYRLSEVQIPPDENNQLNQTSSIISIDIYKSDSKLLFQCRAESEGQVIYSDVAKVTIACKWIIINCFLCSSGKSGFYCISILTCSTC